MVETKKVLSSAVWNGTSSLKNEILCPKCGESCHIAVELEHKWRKYPKWQTIRELEPRERALLKGRLTRVKYMYESHIRRNHNLTYRSRQRYSSILGILDALDNYRRNHNHRDGMKGVWFRKKSYPRRFIRIRTYHYKNGKRKYCASKRIKVNDTDLWDKDLITSRIVRLRKDIRSCLIPPFR